MPAKVGITPIYTMVIPLVVVKYRGSIIAIDGKIMKKLLTAAVVAASSLVLFGCQTDAPECGASEIQDALKQIYMEEVVPVQEPRPDLLGFNGSGVGNIKQTSYNESSKSRTCSASFKITWLPTGAAIKQDVYYSVKLIDGGRFYVEILKLQHASGDAQAAQ